MKDGFYWVKLVDFPDLWVVACRCYDGGEWMTCGNETGWHWEQVAEVGPRIEEPYV